MTVQHRRSIIGDSRMRLIVTSLYREASQIKIGGKQAKYPRSSGDFTEISFSRSSPPDILSSGHYHSPVRHEFRDVEPAANAGRAGGRRVHERKEFSGLKSGRKILWPDANDSGLRFGKLPPVYDHPLPRRRRNILRRHVAERDTVTGKSSPRIRCDEERSPPSGSRVWNNVWNKF